MEQAITRVVTGLIVGWLVRTAMKSERDFGVIGDLVTGSLGAVVGGWLVRQLDIVTPNNLTGHIVVSIFGAGVLLALARIARHAVGAGLSSSPQAAALVGELEEQILRLTTIERRVLSSMLRRGGPPDPNLAFDQQLTVGQRVADRVAAFGGSWTFIGIFLTGMLIWMAVNRDEVHPFDPYPYILLNLLLSCVAALQAPVIMMSQNRQEEKDRMRSENDYLINLKAEMEIRHLHQKIDLLLEEQVKTLFETQEKQFNLLTEINLK